MPEETITFELIRRVQREEQRQPKLSKLPDNFFSSVSSYLQQKRKIEREDRRSALEMKSIERLVEDMFDRRERKVLNAAIIAARTNIPPENLTEEEREFFEKILLWLRERRKNNLKKMLTEEKEGFATLIVFKEDSPEFLGADEKTYGPFKKGDMAKLPEENMKILIDRGLAEEFKISK